MIGLLLQTEARLCNVTRPAPNVQEDTVSQLSKCQANDFSPVGMAQCSKTKAARPA